MKQYDKKKGVNKREERKYRAKEDASKFVHVKEAAAFNGRCPTITQRLASAAQASG